jgi:hypothetical protein
MSKSVDDFNKAQFKLSDYTKENGELSFGKYKPFPISRGTSTPQSELLNEKNNELAPAQNSQLSRTVSSQPYSLNASLGLEEEDPSPASSSREISPRGSHASCVTPNNALITKEPGSESLKDFLLRVCPEKVGGGIQPGNFPGRRGGRGGPF